MRANWRSLAAAGLVCWAAGTVSLAAEEKKIAPKPPAPPALLQPAAGDAGFPIGSRCNVQTVRSGTQLAHSGKILKVTAEWLVLEQSESTATMPGVPILNKVPYKSRLFTAGKPESGEIWIPRDTIQFISINPAVEKTVARPALLCELQPGVTPAKKSGVMKDSFIIRASATEPASPRKIAAIDVTAVERSTFRVAAAIPVLQTGALYRIVVQPQRETNPGMRTTYLGRIIAIQGDQLVFAPGRAKPGTVAGYSLLTHLPWLARLISPNTVVGVESAEGGEIRIKLNQIIAITAS